MKTLYPKRTPKVQGAARQNTLSRCVETHRAKVALRGPKAFAQKR